MGCLYSRSVLGFFSYLLLLQYYSFSELQKRVFRFFQIVCFYIYLSSSRANFSDFRILSPLVSWSFSSYPFRISKVLVEFEITLAAVIVLLKECTYVWWWSILAVDCWAHMGLEFRENLALIGPLLILDSICCHQYIQCWSFEAIALYSTTIPEGLLRSTRIRLYDCVYLWASAAFLAKPQTRSIPTPTRC
jgi:hypothetical protein